MCTSYSSKLCLVIVRILLIKVSISVPKCHIRIHIGYRNSLFKYSFSCINMIIYFSLCPFSPLSSSSSSCYNSKIIITVL